MNELVLEKRFTIFTNINTKNIGPFSRIYELESTLNPFKSYEICISNVVLMSKEKGSAPFKQSRVTVFKIYIYFLY